MKPQVPRLATVHSLLSAWARCQQIDVRRYRASGNRGTLLDRDFSLGQGARWLSDCVLDGWLPASVIVDHHSHVPLFARLMLTPEAMAWRNRLMTGRCARDPSAGAIRKLNQVESSTLRRCPTCVALDQQRFGHAHWRLHHQWPVARHCAEHGDALETRCSSCKSPFIRNGAPQLADDPCHFCGGTQGEAKHWAAPPGYWPMLREMFRLLQLRPCESYEPEAHAPPKGWTPRGIGAMIERRGLPEPVHQALSAWGVDSLPKLANQLGENWVWFNSHETSAHRHRWPPLVSLAIRVSGFIASNEVSLGGRHAGGDAVNATTLRGQRLAA